jgi:mannitol/fructose-specific phosphotransferase system IIA component (Ntr-type)
LKAAGRSSPTIVSLARTPRAVDLVFLLLLPVADGGRLNALASVARKLRKSETTAALRNASDGVELHHTTTAD